MTATTEPAESAVTTIKPGMSRGFKIFLAVLASLLTLTALIFAGGAAHTHASVDQFGKTELFYIQQSIATQHDLPLKQVLSSKVNTDVDGYYQTLTRFPRVTDRDFTMQLLTSDGYTWNYDSRTNMFHGACSNVACFFGIHTQGPFALGR